MSRKHAHLFRLSIFDPPQPDSVDASSPDSDDPDEHTSFIGYKSHMNTRIGEKPAQDSETERLQQLHEGRHRSDGDYRERERALDRTRTAQTVCSSLPLANHERENVVEAVENIHLERFGSQRNLIGVVLGVVAVLVDERHRERVIDPDPDDDPLAHFVRRSEEFRSICDQHDISASDRSTLKKKVREALDDGELVDPYQYV